MAEGQAGPQLVSSSKGAPAGCYERLRGDGEPTRHVCVMGVSERDDEALREASLSFGEVLSIKRNAKVSPNMEDKAYVRTMMVVELASSTRHSFQPLLKTKGTRCSSLLKDSYTTFA